MHTGDWKYKGGCSDDRLTRLQVAVPIEDIANRLKQEMQVLCCHTRDCCDEPGYKRIIYCAEIAPELFDQFFNSQHGYRGAYFKSPETGISANNVVLDIVSPTLIAWTRAQRGDEDAEFALASLSAQSAKVWLSEQTLAFCDRCEGEWHSSLRSDLEIINGRWECDPHTHAKWGRQAHWFKKLRFIGAFLNKAEEEYVAPHKRSRATQIWSHGWS